MARFQFYHTVWYIDDDGNVKPADGVQAQAFGITSNVEDEEEASIFQNRTGGTAASGESDGNGAVAFWLDPGDYNVHFVDPDDRIADFVVGASAISGEVIELGQIPTLTLGKLPALSYSNIDGFDGQVQSIIDAQEPLWLAARGRIYSSVNQTITGVDFGDAATFQQVTFDTVSEDFSNTGDDICDIANNRLVIPYTGLWALQCGVIFNNAGGGDQVDGIRALDLRIGSATRIRDVRPAQNVGMYLQSARTYYCTTGQFITAWVYAPSTAGADKTLLGGTSTQYPFIEATYLGPRPTE